MLKKHINTIKESPLFHNINEEDILCMLKCFVSQVYTFDQNSFIVNSGEPMNKFGILLEGEAIVSKENANGNRIIISTLKKGDLFGEMLVFSSHKTWPSTVTAHKPCKVLFFANSHILTTCGKMCPWHHQILRNFLRIVSDKGLQLNQKVGYLSIKSIQGKIATYLLDQYQLHQNSTITLPFNRNELADFLNISRPSMSREMCKMRDEGLIDFHLSCFKIINLEALKKLCL